MKIIFKVGPSDARRTSGGGFKATDNPATAAKEISESFLLRVMSKADGIADDKLKEKVSLIEQRVASDLDKYAKQTTSFFFKQQSTDGSILFINMNRFEEGQRGLGFTSGGINSLEKARNITLRWLPLSAKTIKNKKGNRTYFVHTGNLLGFMEDNFAQFLKMIIHPSVIYTPVKRERLPTGAFNIISHANITVSLLAGKRGRTLSELPFLKSKNPGESLNDLIGRRPAENNLIKLYMNQLVQRKLLNSPSRYEVGTERPIRSMVTPIIAYWVLSRFPVVASRAFKRVIGE